MAGYSTNSSSSLSTNRSQSTSFIPNYSQTPILESIAKYAEQMAPQVYDWGMQQWGKNQGDVQQMLDTARSYASPQRIAADMGQAEAGVEMGGNKALAASRQQLQDLGVDPSSGRYQALEAGERVQNAAAAAGAGNQQRQADINTGQALEQAGVSAELQNQNTGIASENAANAYLGTAMRLPYSPLGTASSSSGQSSSQSTGGSVSGDGGGGGSGGGGKQNPQGTSNDATGNANPYGLGSGGGGGGSGDGGSGGGFLDGAGGGGDSYSGDGGGSSFTDVPGGGDQSGDSGYGDSGSGWNDAAPDYSAGFPDAAPDYSQEWNDAAPDYSSGGGDYSGGGDGFASGGPVPQHLSPSGGRQTDDVPAEIDNDGAQAHLNTGEFVLPKDVVAWKGQEFFHNLVAQSRKKRVTAAGTNPHYNMGGAI